MAEPGQAASYAYLCVQARGGNARSDAILATLPAPDEIIRRGRVLFKTADIEVAQLDAAVAELFERMHQHNTALRAIRADVKIRFVIVADQVVERLQLHLSAQMVAWLRTLDANVWFDVFSEAPPGTENGPVCGYCRLERPAPGEERVVELLNGWGPHHGIADARLAVQGLYDGASEPITTGWKYLYAPLNDLGVFVLAGRPCATDLKRDGAVAVGILMKRLRAAPKVWKTLRAPHEDFREVRVQHWSNAPRSGACLTRRDVRRMARLGAAFSYQIIPDPKPSFAEDGRCNHCEYVQAWSTEPPETNGQADDEVRGP